MYYESTNEKERKGGRDNCNFSQGRSRVIKGGDGVGKIGE
jgi:hypothetical protein